MFEGGVDEQFEVSVLLQKLLILIKKKEEGGIKGKKGIEVLRVGEGKVGERHWKLILGLAHII